MGGASCHGTGATWLGRLGGRQAEQAARPGRAGQGRAGQGRAGQGRQACLQGVVDPAAAAAPAPAHGRGGAPPHVPSTARSAARQHGSIPARRDQAGTHASGPPPRGLAPTSPVDQPLVRLARQALRHHAVANAGVALAAAVAAAGAVLAAVVDHRQRQRGGGLLRRRGRCRCCRRHGGRWLRKQERAKETASGCGREQAAAAAEAAPAVTPGAVARACGAAWVQGNEQDLRMWTSGWPRRTWGARHGSLVAGPGSDGPWDCSECCCGIGAPQFGRDRAIRRRSTLLGAPQATEASPARASGGAGRPAQHCIRSRVQNSVPGGQRTAHGSRLGNPLAHSVARTSARTRGSGGDQRCRP